MEGLIEGDATARAGGVPALEKILDRAHEAFVSIDEDGRIRAWNREAERTFGWAKESVLGQKLEYVLVPPRYRERHREGLRLFLATGEGPLINKRLEITALHRSGRELPVEVTIAAIDDGGRWSFHAFLHDISERRRGTELQAQLATLVEHAADAIMSRTPEGVITSWNRGAEQLYGYTVEEVLGLVPEWLVPVDRAAEERDLIASALRGEPVNGFETERLAKDGRRIDVSITISPIRDDAGRVAELALFTRDITASKEAERARARAYEELSEASELKSQLVAVASHEIRTPLTSIVGFASTLVARWEDLPDADRLEFLRLIEGQGLRLHRLVDDVLVFSRIEAGATRGAPGDVHVARVARSILEELRLDGEVGLAIEAPCVARADPAQVHQILLNFVANAVAYGAPPYRIEGKVDGGTVTVCVVDGGGGVPEAFVPHLFEAYTRALGHEGGGKNGAGLGLAIAKGLAESQEGEVWYEPNQPRGSRFCVRLPQAGS